MFFWRKPAKPSFERARDWFKHNREPGQGTIVQADQLEVCQQGADFFTLTPIDGGDRLDLQEEGKHA